MDNHLIDFAGLRVILHRLRGRYYWSSDPPIHGYVDSSSENAFLEKTNSPALDDAFNPLRAGALYLRSPRRSWDP
jgi:hypothetical protein